jgi:hypothetical protein
MELEQSIESLDGVAEPLRVLYSPNEDGKGYKLAVDPSQLEEALVPGLKSALQKEREQRKKMERSANDLKSQFEGVDLEEYQELRKLKDETERKKLETAGEWDKLKEQINTQHKKELDKREQREGQLLGQIQKLIVDNVATSAIAGAKGEPELLLPHIRSRTAVVEENGEFEVRVLNNKGEPRVNADGEYMTITDLITEMRNDNIFSRAFDGSGASGGGTPPSKSGGAGSTKKRSEMSVDEKSEYIEKHGIQSFLSLAY